MTFQSNPTLRNQSENRKDIAIIGVSGRFPGGANSPELLWDTLKSGRDAVGEAQGDRWDLGWHNPDKERDGRIYTRAGGFLDQIDGFDAEFFGLSPREAQQIDPQQRLLLELAWEAHESAGIAPRSLAGSDTGVFIGISNSDYKELDGGGWPDAYSNTGNAFSIAANRISYVLDLHGPSFAVDTACSSSLVCVHQACQAILSGECSTALAGGVNILADVGPWLGFSKASMLSPSGRCKSFDESGDGYVRSEGGGLILLKPLEDAERDGDNILGVIRGTGINSDGRTLGLSMPNGEQQEALLRQVYSSCDVSPEQVFYVEAHGTGTSVGDPIECGALARVLGETRTDGTVCHIGSVKSNIGHLEPASGIAGLTKLLMALKYRELPGNLHFDTPNPKIDFDGWNLSVVTEPVALPDREEPLVFGVNSFGFGGTNAHVVLQEYRAPEKVEPAVETPDLLVLSGNSENALRDLATSYVELLRAPEADWAAIASATALCRSPLRNRLAVRAASAAEAADRLEGWLAGETAAGTAAGAANAPVVPTAFVYSGNGPQWWGMGRQLLAENEVFRAEVEAVDAIFAPLSGWSLIDEMAKPEEDSRIALTEVAQPMLFALQLGLTKALAVEGIRPAAVVGHSVGEVASAWASGALDRKQATEVIFHRSREQAGTAGMGRMAAISIDPETAQEEIAKIDGWLELAATNGPDAVTVAGDETALTKLADEMTAQGKFARVLPLNYPFHTKAMDTIRDGLMASLKGLSPKTSDVPFISSVDGAELAGDLLDADYWFRNVRAPVKFHEAISHMMAEQEIALFIEIGPHPVLKDYVGQSARSAGSSAVALPTLKRPGKKGPEHDGENLSTAVAAAHAHGATRLEDLFKRPANLPALPLYPWQHERHWRGSVAQPDAFVPITKDHPLLGRRLPATDGHWENPVDAELHSYLKDHVVSGSVLFPAAGYVEQALTAASLTLGSDVFDVETFEILRPLVLTPQFDPLVQTVSDARDGSIEISSRRDRDSLDFTIHSRGRISAVEDADLAPVDLAAIASRMVETVSSEAHFEDATKRGLDYGPAFQGIKSVQLTAPDAAIRESLAVVQLPELAGDNLADYRSHPAIFDSCLQAIITLIAQNDRRNVSTIPVQLERVRSFAPLTSDVVCHVEIIRESLRSCVADFRIMTPEGKLLLEVKGARCQKVDLTNSIVSPLTSEWWRPDTNGAFKGALSALPSAQTVLTKALDAVGADPEGAAIRSEMDKVAGLYAIKALDAVRPDGDKFDISSVSRHSRIRREHTALLTQIIAMAEAAGQVKPEGRGWIWMSGQENPSADALWAELFREHPKYQAELLLLAQAGDGLVAQLTGKDVAEKNAALIDQIRDTSPFSSDANRLSRAAVEAMVSDWPNDRPMRILEIGGGSGGLAAWVLPLLPAERADYLFTDPSEAAIARAERRFGDHKFVRYATLEPGLGLDEQGQPSGYFDLVLASDLSAFGKGVPALLESLKPAMADGARILVSSPAEGALSSLVLGARSPITAADLAKAGFEDAQTAALPSGSEGQVSAQLIMAGSGRVDSEAPTVSADVERYLVIAEDQDGFATEVVKALEASGQSAELVGFPSCNDPKVELAEAFVATKPQHVVLLGAKAGDGDFLTVQTLRSLTAVALVDTLEEARQDQECDMVIVTRGAFPDGNGNAPVDPAEAALWGMGRVIGNEHTGFGLKMVDLHADGEGATEAAWLAAELLRQDDETEVQIAHGHRYVNRERITSLADEARHAGQKAESFALDFTAQGGLDSLHLRTLERKAPAAGEVEIAVKAAGLNFRDVLWCMGMLPEEAVEHGFSGPTIGMECAGEIVRVGEGVTHVAAGDRVVAFASSCFGSHVTTSAGSVDRIPDGMAYGAAATIPTTFLTAWYGFDHLARLEAGETVLIHGAAGGVGLAAIQIAQLKGAKIIGTAGSPQKRRMLELLGVDHVLNSRTLEFADQVMEITNGVGVDVVLNSLAGEAITKSLQCLRPFGRFLEIGKIDFYANSRIGLRPFRNNLSYFGIDADTLLIERPELAKRLFNNVIEHFRNGDLKPLPHQLVPVSRAAEAFRAMQQSRHVGKLVVSMELDRTETLPVVRSGSGVKADGTYLVTGGLGGFGLETARWLADEGATSLALVSRSGAKSDEAKAALAEFEAQGVTVRAYAADIADPLALQDVLDAIRADMLPLKGVIHSAAVIEDAPILAIEKDQLQRVFLPKMVGALNLHNLTLGDPLEMFVLYSSSSAVVGNPGQGAYVAANLYLDALAMQRRSMGLPGLAIGWGAIQDAGFLTRHEAVKDMLKSRTGLDATPAREALADLGRVSAAGASRVSVARFDIAKLHQMLPAAQAPRFLPIVPTGSGADLSADETLGDLLEAMPKSERRTFVIERVKENAARVIGTSASQVNADKPLGELGLDSLMAVELAGILERDIGQTVPVMQLLGAESLSAVAEFVLSVLGVEGEGETKAPADAQTKTGEKATIAKVD